MDYRQPVINPQSTAREELARLAQEGRHVRPAGLENHESSGKALREQRKSRRQLRRSCSRFAELSSWWVRLLMLGPALVLMAVVMDAVWSMWLSQLEPNQFVFWTAWVAFWVLICSVLHLVGAHLSGRAVAREQQWIGNLGYEVRGYFEALSLGGSWVRSGRREVHVSAAESVVMRVEVFEPFDPSFPLSDVLRATSATAECLELQPLEFTIQQRDLGCKFTCHALRRWVHRVATQMLDPIHRGYRIRRVTITTRSY